jgi:hypothetical protein
MNALEQILDGSVDDLGERSPRKDAFYKIHHRVERKREDNKPVIVTALRMITMLKPGYKPGIKPSSHSIKTMITLNRYKNRSNENEAAKKVTEKETNPAGIIFHNF